jgi:uncharacterized membrane protein
MAIAVLALVGLLAYTYLLLYKLGVVGSLVCGGSGACERVQNSPYAEFLGFPVAAYGIAGFAALLALALAGLDERWAAHPGPSWLVAACSGIGVLFAIYLTYLEIAVIHDICKWCVGIAVTVTTIFIVSLLGARSFRTAPAP